MYIVHLKKDRVVQPIWLHWCGSCISHMDKVAFMKGKKAMMTVLTVLAAVVGFLMILLVIFRLARMRADKRIVSARLRRFKEEKSPHQEELVKPTMKLFEMDQESMGLSPAEAFAKMRHGWYFIPSFLGNSEKEELLMRVVKPSLEAGRWVGVAWSSLISQMVYEVKADRAGVLEDRPFSVIFVAPLQNVLATFHPLKDEGFFRVEEIDGEHVVFPTPTLVEKVVGAKPVTV